MRMVAAVNRYWWLLLLAMVLFGVSSEIWAAANTNTQAGAVVEQGDTTIMQAFNDSETKKTGVIEVADKTKRLVMFVMGVPLLILLLATAALGVAMGIYGKQVYVPHMICAGLSLTLALGHAVVGIVWFYPF
jgi:hypothetical protein